MDEVTLEGIAERLDRIEAELAEIKALLLPHTSAEAGGDAQDPYQEFLGLAGEVSRLWSGPGAAEEIRTRREEDY